MSLPLLLALGLGTSAALAVAGSGLAGVLGLWTLGFAACLRLPQRWRMLTTYLFTLAVYRGVEWIVPALGATVRDPELLAIDRAVFGETPAVTLQAWGSAPLSEVLSACYLSYHLYLHGALGWAIYRRDERLYDYVFTAFALGLAGYLLVPATGPAIAYPALFTEPLRGGWMTALNAAFIGQGTSLYDVFPSLHVLITVVLLDHDWRHARRRFWWVIGPALGLFVSTLYLRYHYAVDLAAGLLVWLAARQIHRRWGKFSSTRTSGA